MAKNDFDRDFDFEKEYGFDPDTILGAEEYDSNIDLSQFSDEELGLGTDRASAPGASDPGASDPDPDAGYPDLGLRDKADDPDSDMDLDAFLNMADRPEDDDGKFPEDTFDDFDVEGDPEEDDLAEDLDFSGNAGLSHGKEFEDSQAALDGPPPQEADMEDNTEHPEEYTVDETQAADESQTSTRRRKPAPQPRPKKKPRKPAGPNFFTKFYDLYFAPLLNKELQEPTVDPKNPRRRRRKSKMQIFKEVYLPPIVVCVALILVLSFAIGSLSNFISQRRIDKSTEQSRLDSSQSAADLAQQEQARVLAEAERLATGYDYDGAIELLESLGDLTAYPDIATKRSEYSTARSNLVEYQDVSTLPNLSFHALINDLPRALKDTQYGGKYNQNFVSTTEFSNILEDLYENNYVLVDFDSFTAINPSDPNIILPKSIYLPQGKKPFMLTETLVNYFAYMIDSDRDGTPDAGGAGFASRLVVDSNGDIKAEYVDSTGATLVGNYDLVPILEDFIAQHPDFSYQGARATLGVTGDEGIFGYRINSSYTATMGQNYTNEQVAGAKEIVQALRDKGYTLACYTFENIPYASKNANQIRDDLQKWTSQITPIIGELNTFVFAQASDLTNYTDTSFQVMYQSGFRYFVANGASPSTEVRSNYVRQQRLMVTGSTMAHNPSWFTGMFDCAAILDVNTRGNVPTN